MTCVNNGTVGVMLGSEKIILFVREQLTMHHTMCDTEVGEVDTSQNNLLCICEVCDNPRKLMESLSSVLSREDRAIRSAPSVRTQGFEKSVQFSRNNSMWCIRAEKASVKMDTKSSWRAISHQESQLELTVPVPNWFDEVKVCWLMHSCRVNVWLCCLSPKQLVFV